GGGSRNARTTHQDLCHLCRDRGVTDGRGRAGRRGRAGMNTPSDETDEIKPPSPGGQAGMRFSSFGMPAEKPKDFGSASRRVLQYGMSFILAGVVQRTMYRLRADVEAKLNHLPLSYVDRAQRGDLLSRVTNDIDNIAQSLQQTLSQMLTQVLTIVGTVAMMIWISWMLSLVAVVTIPLSMFMMNAIAKRSRTRF